MSKKLLYGAIVFLMFIGGANTLYFAFDGDLRHAVSSFLTAIMFGIFALAGAPDIEWGSDG